MRLGAFELNEPLPELNEPHALAMLRPWIDMGSVGSLTLSWLEAQLKARELARIARPGNFFDFTRYRPVVYFSEGSRQVSVPNVRVTCGRQETGNDFIFLHLLEPHALGEMYVDSVLRLLTRFGVKRFCLLGSMYDLVPHTRPLLITGTATGQKVQADMDEFRIEPSEYEGPTTITFLVLQHAQEMGIETTTLIVHLPQYATVEEDYVGFTRLMEILSTLYGIPVDEVAVGKAEQQEREISATMDRDPQLKAIVQQLESRYDARAERRQEKGMPPLSPEIERFLREMGKRFGEG